MKKMNNKKTAPKVPESIEFLDEISCIDGMNGMCRKVLKDLIEYANVAGEDKLKQLYYEFKFCGGRELSPLFELASLLKKFEPGYEQWVNEGMRLQAESLYKAWVQDSPK